MGDLMADQLLAGDTDERTILTTDIDLDFAPLPVPEVMTGELGDELVLFDAADDVLFALDRVGAILWRCFDGEVTLRELADDIVAVLDAPLEQVREDLVNLARRLGVAGLLAGVVTPQANAERQGTLNVGDELTPFALPDMNGDQVDIRDLRGHRVMLVNWSPTCGFCLRIAPELAELSPKLAENDVELVFLSNGSPAENQEVFDEHGLHARTLLEPSLFDDDDDDEEEEDAGKAEHHHADGDLVASADAGDEQDRQDDHQEAQDDYPDPFPAMGTPVAYLLDRDGRVAAPIATGANEVPALARSIAGIEEEVLEELPADAKYLNLSEGDMCGPGGGGGGGKVPRVWADTAAYGIGDYRVGVRPDSSGTDGIVARFLAGSRLPEGTRAPGDYSIVLGDGGTSKRGLNLVLEGNSTVVRTRSPRRALLGLAGYLASHLPGDTAGLLRVRALGVIVDGEAAILPADVNGWLDELQPRLARLGARPIDRPFVTIDVERRQVIVDEPALPLDLSVLEDLPQPTPRRSELAMVEPGRYPLRRWLIWQSNEEPPLTPGQLATRAMATCTENAGVFEAGLLAVDALRRDGVLFPFDFMTIDELLKRLPAAVAGQPHGHIAAKPATVERAETA